MILIQMRCLGCTRVYPGEMRWLFQQKKKKKRITVTMLCQHMGEKVYFPTKEISEAS